MGFAPKKLQPLTAGSNLTHLIMVGFFLSSVLDTDSDVIL